MALPSSINSFRSPSFHVFSLLLRHVMCSFIFEVRLGFCRSRIGRIVAARRAMDSINDMVAKAKNSLESSLANSFPALPSGSKK